MFERMDNSDFKKTNRNRSRYLIFVVVFVSVILVSYLACVYFKPVRDFIFPVAEKTESQVNDVFQNENSVLQNENSVLQNEMEVSQAPVSSVDQSTTPIEIRSENEIYKEMHKMANTKIVADQVWGEIDIIEERVNALISEISQSSYDDKDKLIHILENWKSGNFSDAVEEHNYLWEWLGGTVGKAYKLK